MFGAKKKKFIDEKESLEKQVEDYRRQTNLSQKVGGSIMGFAKSGTTIQNCIETEGQIESCTYLDSLSEPPAIVYHYSEDDEAKLFLVGDVAGRGKPASLIAVYIKGLFEQAADSYKISGGTTWIGNTLMEINQKLSEKGLFDRFVSINILLVWKQSGIAYLWSMGGAPIFLFRKTKGQLKKYEINQSPALGIFDSDLLKIQGGDSFGPKKITLQTGDSLLLIDDGFDESIRPQVTENQKEDEDENEEFGVEWVEQVLKAALTGGKVEIPAPDHSFQWCMNMEGISPTPKNTLLSLVAAEKLFRLSPVKTKSSAAASNAAKDTAKATTEMIQLLGKLVDNGSFQVGDDRADETEEHSLTGYTELPQLDEQFALAIRRS